MINLMTRRTSLEQLQNNTNLEVNKHLLIVREYADIRVW